jgi:hypothetical protein
MGKLEEMAESALHVARGIIEDSTDGHEAHPVWFILDTEGRITVVMTPFNGEGVKEKVFQMMPAKLKEMNAVAYVFLSEVWTVKRDTSAVDLDTPPSEQPDRIEALMLQGNDLHNNQLMWVAEIKRMNGKRTVSEPEKISGVQMRGRGANLLRPETFQ